VQAPLALRYHACEGRHPVTHAGATKAEVPFIESSDDWIVRFRGR
jgi:hypothetical protein